MARREQGTGSIYQRKDGSWVAQYRGSYRYAKTEQEARRKLRQRLRSTAGEGSENPSNITVGTALDDYYLKSARQHLKTRTVTRYAEVIELHLKPAFGGRKLHTLTAIEVERLYAVKLQSLSPSTAQLIHAVLSSAIKRAVRLRLVQANVCSDVQRPRIDRDEVEVFDPQVGLTHVGVLQVGVPQVGAGKLDSRGLRSTRSN